MAHRSASAVQREAEAVRRHKVSALVGKHLAPATVKFDTGAPVLCAEREEIALGGRIARRRRTRWPISVHSGASSDVCTYGIVFLRARLRVAADENLVGNAHRWGVIGVWASSGEPAHVVIVGGGFAALEAALALSALAADSARVTLISPDPVFAYRPAATVEAIVEAPHSATTWRRLLLISERATAEVVLRRWRRRRSMCGWHLSLDSATTPWCWRSARERARPCVVR